MKPIKTPILNHIDNYQLPNEYLVDLMGEVLAHGGNFRFKAKGASMAPFIKDGDKITIVPITLVAPTLGRVVACICSQSEKLIVHRIVDKDHNSVLLKGDNSLTQPDGWFAKENIIGVVTRIERGDRDIKFGLGLERWLISYLSKKGLLSRLVNRLRKLF